MAILTGDRYLDLLARFVEDQAGGLLDGSLVLKLNPVGLYYVQTRLDALHELERLRAGAPVDYLRAYISDLGDHRALEQLGRVLKLLTSVKIVSVLRSPARDPSTVTVSPFGRLKSLELRGCDLSTSAARGLLQLRPILERLICHNSADALRHIFTERIVEVKAAPVWSRLAFVSCAFNGMVFMDDSLQLLPAVQFLDLSRNRFAKAGNLHRCTKLKFVDLGFNQLRNISSLSQINSQITKLVLKNNALVSVKGIASLTSLEALDLSNNLISKFKEIQSVARIPSLHTILLEGNPVSASVFYREEVFSLFQDPGKVLLDGRKILKSEYWTVSRIKAKRLKQEALYGAYAPAAITANMQRGTVPIELTDPGSDAEASNSRRKVSRLALIHDAQTLLKEVAEQDESQEFHPSSDLPRDFRERRQDSLEDGSMGESEAINLMQKVEALKEEGPKSWIQELRVLLDNNAVSSEQVQQSATLESEDMSTTSDSGMRELRKMQSKRHRRHQRRSFAEGLDANEEHSPDEIIEKGFSSSFQNDFPAHSQFADAIDKDNASLPSVNNLSGVNSATGSPRVSAPTKSTSDQDDSVVPSVEGEEQYEMGNIDETMQVGPLIAADEEKTSLDESFGSWRLLDEVIDSSGTGGGLGSPPHFHENVLQKRQDLEEELLRLSLDSGCAPSSSESESSSDDYLNMSAGSSRSDGSSPKGMVDFREGSPKSTNWDRWQASAHLPGTLEKNSTQTGSEQVMFSGPKEEKVMESSDDQHSLASSTGKENTTEASRSSQVSPACTDDIRANAGGGKEEESNEKTVSKTRIRRKPRRARTVELYKEDLHDEISRVAPNSQSAETNAVAKPSQMNPEMSERITASSSASMLVSSPPLAQKAGKHVESAEGGDSASQVPRNGIYGSTDLEECVEKFFRQKIANEGESCTRQVRCGCIRLWEETPLERDVHFLLSNKDRLYIIAESNPRSETLSASGSDSGLHVLASHKLRDVKKIMVGLGLQALRVDIGHGASYLIVARDINLSREILEMLRNTDNSGPAPEFASWEQKQIKMFEELILGGTQTSVLMYLMPLFSCGASLETGWMSRSVFLTPHHIFVCIEDLVHFGVTSSEKSMTTNPYFIMEAAADIYDLSEVQVAGFTDDCVTLRFRKTVSGCSTPIKYNKETQDQQSTVWKFKGVFGEAASKLVALLHASHIDFALALHAPLPDCKQF